MEVIAALPAYETVFLNFPTSKLRDEKPLLRGVEGNSCCNAGSGLEGKTDPGRFKCVSNTFSEAIISSTRGCTTTSISIEDLGVAMLELGEDIGTPKLTVRRGFNGGLVSLLARKSPFLFFVIIGVTGQDLEHTGILNCSSAGGETELW